MDDIDTPAVSEDAPSLKTWADLGLAEIEDGKPIWSAAQHVEPTRDGLPWCDWPEGEDMLVNAALPTMRGLFGLHPLGYRVTRDGDTLTLELLA